MCVCVYLGTVCILLTVFTVPMFILSAMWIQNRDQREICSFDLGAGEIVSNTNPYTITIVCRHHRPKIPPTATTTRRTHHPYMPYIDIRMMIKADPIPYTTISLHFPMLSLSLFLATLHTPHTHTAIDRALISLWQGMLKN